MNPYLRRLRRTLARWYGIDKKKAEARYWRNELKHYVDWYEGKKTEWPSPSQAQKVASCNTIEKNAAMTFCLIRKQIEYLHSLQLDASELIGKRILDVGCGPHPSALCFLNCEIYGLDPLTGLYREIGYPMDEYDPRYHFVDGPAEKMPFQDSSFNAVISVNALDHVDDLELVAAEIRRVLQKGGLFRVQVDYHTPTIAEPHTLSDEIVRALYGWIPNLHKISEVKDTVRPEIHGMHVLWSNF
jgi:SAM-dependent methyltransferase